MSKKKLYDFKGFRLDTDQKCLWRGEELVSLTPKALDTLEVLIKNNGKIISKNDILDAVWENTFVEEATLAQNISTLRKTLAKYAEDEEFIVTIPRRGYRFVADVTEINSEEEELFVEKRSVTHIVAEQQEIPDKTDLKKVEIEDEKTAPKAPSRLQSPIGILALVSVFIAGIFLAGLAASAFFTGSQDHYSSKFQNVKMNTLFSGGNISSVVASPDGKYIVVIDQKKEGDTLSLKQITDGNTLEVLPKSDLSITGAAFSPKGDYIYYSGYKKERAFPGAIGKLYKIPLLGGAQVEVLNDVDSIPAISADGTKIAFIRNDLTNNRSSVYKVNLDGTGEKEITSLQIPDHFPRMGLSWSPDSKMLAAVVINRSDGNTNVKIVAIDAESGEQKTLASKDWLWIGNTVWLEDGSGIAFVAYGSKSPNLTDEIWFASYPEGEARVLANGIRGLGGLSIAGDSLFTTKLNRIKSSLAGTINEIGSSQQIAKTLDEESLLPLGSSWLGDEKIVFSQTKNGNADVWIMNSDGSKLKQLTADVSIDYSPIVSEDKQKIFFLSNRNGTAGIWRMDINGQDQKEIVSLPNIIIPTFSVSGEHVYYSKNPPDKTFPILWRTDLDGKNPQQITSTLCVNPAASPDGKYVYCIFRDAKSGSSVAGQALYQAVLSAETGEVIKQFEEIDRTNIPIIEWKKSGEGYFVAIGSKLFLQNIENESRELIKDFGKAKIYQMSLSKSGERVFYETGEEVISVLKLEDR